MFHLERADAELLTTCRAAGVTEVYLAVDARILSDARLPSLVASLHGAGIRVEALMGEAAWYRPESRAGMLGLVDRVAAYDAGVQTTASRFEGVHFDIEPHQLAENKGKRTYLPALAATLAEGRTRASTYGLSAAADLPRFAIEDAPELRETFARAVPRIFLMLYELRDRSGDGVTRAAGVTAEHMFEKAEGSMVIGLSVDDYADRAELTERRQRLEHERPGATHYGGWAIHDERRFAAKQ